MFHGTFPQVFARPFRWQSGKKEHVMRWWLKAGICGGTEHCIEEKYVPLERRWSTFNSFKKCSGTNNHEKYFQKTANFLHLCGKISTNYFSTMFGTASTIKKRALTFTHLKTKVCSCSEPESTSSTTTKVSFFFLKSNLMILGLEKMDFRLYYLFPGTVILKTWIACYHKRLKISNPTWVVFPGRYINGTKHGSIFEVSVPNEDWWRLERINCTFDTSLRVQDQDEPFRTHAKCI